MGFIRITLAIWLLCTCSLSCQHTSVKKTNEPQKTWSEIQKAPSSEASSGSPSIETILSESHFVFETPDKYTLNRIHRYKILNEKGLEDWGVALTYWYPWRQNKPVIEATVTGPDGSSVKLDQTTIVEQTVQQESHQLITNNRKFIAPLPQIQVGSVVEVRTSIEHLPSVYGPAMTDWHTFGAVNRKILHSRLVLEHPKSMDVKTKQKGVSIEPTLSTNNNNTLRSFDLKNIDPIKAPESNLPIHMVVTPYIEFSTGKSWAHLARIHHDTVKPQFDASTCTREIDALIPKEGSRGSRIEALVANLQSKVRYTGLELGENAIVPVSPCETLKRGFGDCKDQATVLVTALGRMKIKANLALVNSGYDVDVDPDLPSLMGFNHVIVYVPGKKPLWIDSTLDHGRVGELSTSTQDRGALILSKSTKNLTPTPSRSSDENTYKETRTINLAVTGSGSITEESSYSGAYERYERGRAAGSNTKDFESNIKSYLENAYRAEKLIKATQIDPDDLSKNFGYRIEGDKAGIAQTDSKSAATALSPWSLFEYTPTPLDPRNFEKKDLKEKRIAPMEVYTPGRVEIAYRVAAPLGHGLKLLPKSETHTVGPMSFGVEYVKENERSVSANYFFDTGHGMLTPEQYVKIRKALLEWTDEFPVVLEFDNIGMKNIAAGKFKDALIFLQDIIKKSPDESVYHQWYSTALLATGFGEAAQKAARRATVLSPDSIDAWIALGWALEHNFLAQRLETGYHRKDAISVYRKAISLDEKHQIARMSLAILLEHDQHGGRYMDVNDLNSAVSQYQKILDNAEDLQVKKNMLVSKLLAGRFKEVIDDTKERPDDSFLATLRLTAICATEGAQKGIEASELLFENEATRLGGLTAATNYLTHTRKYLQASKLLQASARGSAGADNQIRASRLAKVKLTDGEFKFSKGPEGIIQKMYLEAFDESKTSIKDLWSPKIVSYLPGDYETTFTQELRKGMKMGRTDLPTAVMKDLVVSLITIRKRGNDKLGYKMSIGNDDNSDVTMYVIKEKRSYHLVDVHGVGLSGRLIWDDVVSGDLTRARKWLDWIAEDRAINGMKKFWTVGCNGDKDKASAAALKIMSNLPETAQLALDRIEEIRAGASATLEDDKLNDLLLSTYTSLKKEQEIIALAQKMIRDKQETELAWISLMMASNRAKDFAVLKKLARKTLAKDPDNKLVDSALSMALLEGGDTGEYWKRTRKKESRSPLDSDEYNNLAWITLFSQGTLKQGLEYSLRSLESNKGSVTSRLHTLATLHAEIGNTTESHQLLQKILKAYKNGKPRRDDWYVIGRLAEHYRLKEVAIDSYCRIEKPEHHKPIDTYNLARKRLRKLNVKNCDK